MKREVLLGVLGAIIGTIVVVAGAIVLLRPDSPVHKEAASKSVGPAEQPAALPPRPSCPGPTVGGVELDCLGGDEGTSPEGLTVVNMWAWWCEPCRGELPIIEQYAQQHPDITVVGVHADPAADRGASFLDELGVDLPSYQDPDNTFGGTLGLPGVIPITLVFRGDEQLGVFPRVFHSTDELDAAVTEVS